MDKEALHCLLSMHPYPLETKQNETVSLGCSVSRLLTRHNQEIAQWSPDPFPCERVGSGHETNFP